MNDSLYEELIKNEQPIPTEQQLASMNKTKNYIQKVIDTEVKEYGNKWSVRHGQ